MDAREQLEELDRELDNSARYILITPAGWDISGWSQAEAALLLEEMAEVVSEAAKDELIEGRE